MKKETAAIAFRLICLLFSALLAISTLLTGIDRVAVGERLSALRAEQRQLEKEKERLRAEAACGMSLEELEERAIGELGMQHREPGQIIVIELEK